MKNNIIIAGVPRAGKSTISHILSKEYGFQHISMDSIIAGFEKCFPDTYDKYIRGANFEFANNENVLELGEDDVSMSFNSRYCRFWNKNKGMPEEVELR